MQLAGLLEGPVPDPSDGPVLGPDGPVLGPDGPVLGQAGPVLGRDGLSHGAPRVALDRAVSESDSERIHDPGAPTASPDPSW